MSRKLNNSPNEKLLSFLKQYQLSDKDKADGAVLTHTWLSPPFVKTYNIPPTEYQRLYDILDEVIFTKHMEIPLVERFTNPSLFKIDLDFEFHLDTTTRKYNNENIKEIIKIYNKLLLEHTTTPIQDVNAFVFLRFQGYRDKGKFKDGLHIMYPDILLDTKTQKYIRLKFLEECKRVFDKIELSTPKYDKIVDESIIDRNGWMIYGCTKPSRHPYLLQTIYDYQITEQPNNYTTRDLIEYLSLYNSAGKTEYQLKPPSYQEMEELLKPKSRITSKIISNVRKNNQKSRNSLVDIELIKKLVDILDSYRADDYKSWIDVGLCLYNIDDCLLETWINFSKKSSKFIPGECEKQWLSFKERHDIDVLGLGSLHRWALLDDPINYRTVKRGCLTTLMENSLNGTTHAIARVVYEMYKYQYVCASVKYKIWYEFQNHRWVEIDSGVTLQMKFSSQVLEEYGNLLNQYTNSVTQSQLNQIQNQMSSVNPNNPNSSPPNSLTNSSSTIANSQNPAQNQKNGMSNIAAVFDVMKKLQTMSFKEALMKECMTLFYDGKFYEKLDTNLHLIGLGNGVYDLDKDEFRDGRPEDYISLSTNTDYIDFKKEKDALSAQEIIDEINIFFEQIFPIKTVRDYMWLVLSTACHGKNLEEKFYFHIGTGANGKSKLNDLMFKTLGEYAGTLDSTVLTQKKPASNSATPEIARCRGKRWVTMSEVDQNQRINIGILKGYSGNDPITCREMYKPTIEYKPQFKLSLLTNELPTLPPDDDGVWRRARVIKFLAKFTDNPTKEYEHKKDIHLSDKFESWREAFQYLLIRYYHKYSTEGITEPTEVLEATHEYQKQSDMYADFLDECITKGDKQDTIKPLELYNKFKHWFSNAYNTKPPSKNEIMIHIEKKIGKPLPNQGWKSLKFRPTIIETDDPE